MRIVKRLLGITLEIGVIGIMLVAAGLFFASYYVDTEEFQDRFSQTLSQVVGNPVKLNGELNIALYPSLSLEVLDLVMEDGQDVSKEPLVRFKRILVNVRLIPLLSHQVDINSIIVDGMEIHVVRSGDGTLNWQRTLSSQQPDISTGFGGEGELAGISLKELEVNEAAIVYEDRQHDQSGALRGINFRTGAIVPGRPVPFIATSRFAWDEDAIKSEISLKGILEVDGLEKVILRDGSVDATFGGTLLPKGAKPGELTAKILMDWEKRSIALDHIHFHLLGLRADGKLKSGDLSQSLSATGHITVKPFNPGKLVERFFPELPLSSIDGLKSAALASYVQVSTDGIQLNNCVASLDDLTVRGSIGTEGFIDPRLKFNLRGGLVDIDKYLPLFATDEPFYWEDFNLPFWANIRGSGTVRVDGLTLFETAISDIRLAVDADDKRIAFDAGAIRKGQGSLGGKAELRIGSNGEAGDPTLGMDVSIVAESQKEGFAFLNQPPVNISGKGTVKTDLHVNTMDCPPKERSINLLRALKGNVGLSLGAGEFVHTGKKRFVLEYDDAHFKVKFSSRPIRKSGLYAFSVDSNLNGRGRGRFRKFAVSAKGELASAVDELHVTSPGLKTEVRLSGPLYVEKNHNFHATGKVAFDSKKHWVKIAQASVRTLEAALMGNVALTNVHDAIKASGNLDLKQANIKRLAYMLADEELETDDPDALTTVSALAKLSADRKGFRLTDLEGRFDGVAFSGRVSGNGYVDPLLKFTLSAGVFDLDRYLPPSEDEPEEVTPKNPVPVELPLNVLQWLNFDGRAWFEGFTLAKIKARNVSGNVQALKGKLAITDVKGDVYGGRLLGSAKGVVGKRSLSSHIKVSVRGMESGPFMLDRAKHEYLNGETNADIDLTGVGGTDEAILNSLAGKVSATIRNGSFKFTGFEPEVRIEGEQKMFAREKADRTKRRTLFHVANARFIVRRGTFVVDHFLLDSPLLKSTAKGGFNLAKRNINISLTNDFVAVPSVPMQIVGHLSNPEIKFPKTKMLNDTVRNILSLPEKSFKFFRDLF